MYCSYTFSDFGISRPFQDFPPPLIYSGLTACSSFLPRFPSFQDLIIDTDDFLRTFEINWRKINWRNCFRKKKLYSNFRTFQNVHKSVILYLSDEGKLKWHAFSSGLKVITATKDKFYFEYKPTMFITSIFNTKRMWKTIFQRVVGGVQWEMNNYRFNNRIRCIRYDIAVPWENTTNGLWEVMITKRFANDSNLSDQNN